MIGNIRCLDEKYSTTRLLIQKKLEIINDSKDTFATVLFLPIGENRKGEGGLRTKGYFKKSFKDKPLISIVTVVFNDEKHLEETILSVINQSYDNVEYIIIDGNSTDGTVDIIKKYEDKIDYWVSEKDQGISEAFNKGVSCSLGERLIMLNSGDYFIDCNFFSANIEKLLLPEDVVFFTVRIDDNRSLPPKIISSRFSQIINSVHIPHQGAFVALKAYKNYGLYNPNFKIRMDYDFFLRLISSDLKFKYFNIEVVQYLVGGVSMQFKNRALFELEALISNYYYGKKVNSSRKNNIKKIVYVIYAICKKLL